MAHNCFLRSLITLLHACTAIGTGFVCVFSLIGYNSGKANDCLPSLVDRFGDPITLRSGIPSMCDGILFTLAGLCALNFCMSLFINCHWRNTCVIVLHLVMTLLMFAFSAYSATLFTVHHLLWCDSLLQTVSYSNIGCEEASLRYDRFHTTSNMSDYYKRMEVQQAGLWALVPVLFITSLVYAFSMRVSASWSVDSDDLRGQFRYVILDDESTPILRPQPNTPRALDTPPYSNSFSENTTDINNVGNNGNNNYNVGNNSNNNYNVGNNSNNNYNDGNNEINNGNNDNSNPFEEN